MIYTVALGVGLKCPRKIHMNIQCPPGYLTDKKVLVFEGQNLPDMEIHMVRWFLMGLWRAVRDSVEAVVEAEYQSQFGYGGSHVVVQN